MTSRAAARGQGSVEYIGVVVIVALALAAAAAWALHHVRPPAHPPPVAERVVVPLAGTRLLDGPPAAQRHGFGGSVRRGLRVAVAGGRLMVRGVLAFDAGLAAGLRDTVTGFVRDPIAALRDAGVLAELIHDPAGAGAAAVRAAVAYAVELRAMPPQDAYLRFMHDAGETGVDIAVMRGRATARRLLLRAIRRRLEERAAGGVVR